MCGEDKKVSDVDWKFGPLYGRHYQGLAETSAESSKWYMLTKAKYWLLKNKQRCLQMSKQRWTHDELTFVVILCWLLGIFWLAVIYCYPIMIRHQPFHWPTATSSWISFWWFLGIMVKRLLEPTEWLNKVVQGSAKCRSWWRSFGQTESELIAFRVCGWGFSWCRWISPESCNQDEW